MGPNYPQYPSQPNAGKLPCMRAMGPPDLRPSSSTSAHYQGRINRAHGRYLAGLGGILKRSADMPYFGFSATEFSREVHAACEKSSNSSCETSQGGRYYNDLMQQMKSGVALFGIAGLAIGYFLGKKL